MLAMTAVSNTYSCHVRCMLGLPMPPLMLKWPEDAACLS
jgi:hypothetical protein